MSRVDDMLEARIQNLIEKGAAVLSTKRVSGGGIWVDVDIFHEWRTQSLTFLRAPLGPRAEDYRHQFEMQTQGTPRHALAASGLGILRAGP